MLGEDAVGRAVRGDGSLVGCGIRMGEVEMVERAGVSDYGDDFDF